MNNMIFIIIFIHIFIFGLICGFLFEPFLYHSDKKNTDTTRSSRIFITGDKHRNFKNVKKYCKRKKTTVDDVLIIVGDCGLNYYLDNRDTRLKRRLSKIKITLFCIHGNKECRPEEVGSYGIKSFSGGRVYYEPSFPNILFAIDGEMYCFNNHKYMVIGGAHSVDKNRSIINGSPYWPSELPTVETKDRIIDSLKRMNNEVYGFITHTCAKKYIPQEAFLSAREKNQNEIKMCEKRTVCDINIPLDIDHSFEEWLGKIEEDNNYAVWFCGHYHIDKKIDKTRMLFNDFEKMPD